MSMNVATMTVVMSSLLSTLNGAPVTIDQAINSAKDQESVTSPSIEHLKKVIDDKRVSMQKRTSDVITGQESNLGDRRSLPPMVITAGDEMVVPPVSANSLTDVTRYSDLLPVGVQPDDPLVKDIPQWKLEAFKKIEKCESGGDPTIVSANGIYKGLYQFHDNTWAGIGGTAVAPSANLATSAQQLHYANKLQERYGWSQWECAGIVGVI